MKEWRTLLPTWSVCVFVMSGDLLARPFYQRLDQLSWLDVTSLEKDKSLAVAIAGIALVLAFTAFPREHDERTIEYLYALPVTRLTIYASKVATGLMALWSVIILGGFTNWLLISQNKQTFTGDQWRVGTALSALTLELALATCFYAYGIACSWLRRFGMIVLALLALTAVGLESLAPRFAALNPLHLMAYRYDGQTLLIPGRMLVWHLAVAAGCLALGYWLWMARSEAIALWFQQAEQHTARRWGLRMGALFAGALGLAALAASTYEERETDEAELGASFDLAEVHTAHFTFTYPVNLRERALALIEHADADWDYLQQTLDAEAYEGLVVDMTDDSPEHDGIAAWSTARIGLASIDDPVYARWVLVHELTHIVQHRRSDARMAEYAKSVAFFAEGMAQWMAHERVPMPEKRRHERIAGVATLRRQHLPFEIVSDTQACRERLPPTALYLIGELWTQALVDACGQNAPARVLAAFARPKAPEGLDGRALWQDTLQAMACDLERVLDAQSNLIARIETEHAEQLAAIPRLSGGVTRTTNTMICLRATADRALADGMTATVLVRDDESTEDRLYRSHTARVDRSAPLTYRFCFFRDELARDRFQFAFGVDLHAQAYAVYEPWREGNARPP